MVPEATIKVEYGVDSCKVQIMDTAMFHTPI